MNFKFAAPACLSLLAACSTHLVSNSVGNQQDSSIRSAAVPSGAVRVENGFLPGHVSALAWFPKGAPKAALILNPGGQIPSNSMRDMAEVAVKLGYATYVVENAEDLPILPFNSDNVRELATLLVNSPEKLKNLPANMVSAQKAGLKVFAMGHSMGGAVLGNDINDSKSVLSGIVLLGVSKFSSTPEKMTVPTSFLYGEHDTVTNQSELVSLSSKLGAKSFSVPGVNHFCVISDANVGSADYRKRDGAADAGLNAQGCSERVFKVLQKEKILPE